MIRHFVLFDGDVLFARFLVGLNHLKDSQGLHVFQADVLDHGIAVDSRRLLRIVQHFRELHSVVGQKEEEYAKQNQTAQKDSRSLITLVPCHLEVFP